MTMAFDICRLDYRWCEAAFELAIEMFVRHSHYIWQSEQNCQIAMPMMPSYFTVMFWMVWHLLGLISDLRLLIQQNNLSFFVIFGGVLLKNK